MPAAGAARLSPFTSLEHDSSVDFSNPRPTDAASIGGSAASDRAIEERGGQRKTACHDSVSLADPWRKSAPMESKSMHGRALPRVFRQVRAG